MSKENVDTLQRLNRAFNRRDRAGVLAEFHPELEWRDLEHAPDTPERLQGIGAVQAIWDQWEDAFDRVVGEVEEYIDAGSCVLTVTRWQAMGRESGLAIEQTSVEVYEFADGKIIRATLGYPNKDAALKAVGREE